jgi:hypothetical protein
MVVVPGERSEPLSPIESPPLIDRLQGLAGSAAVATRPAPATRETTVRICIERSFMVALLDESTETLCAGRLTAN